jgi:hypothetical protein
MRTYHPPGGSPYGVSFGTGGSIAHRGTPDPLVGLGLCIGLVFVWPFQFIWKWLPKQFPGKDLAAPQLLLTLAWAPVLVWAAVVAIPAPGREYTPSLPGSSNPAQVVPNALSVRSGATTTVGFNWSRRARSALTASIASPATMV